MKKQRRLLPPLPPAERAALAESIRLLCVQVPLVYDEEGNLLDGWERLEICEQLGLKNYPIRTVSGLSEEEKRHLAYRLNCQRRQLTTTQKRELIATELRRTPDISNNWLAELLGVNDKTVAAVRRELERTSEIPKLVQLRGHDGKRRRYPAVNTETARDAERAARALKELGDDAPRYLDVRRAQLLARIKRSREAREGVLTIPSPSDQIQIHHCDFRKLRLAQNSVRLIYTDPPWQQVELYSDLARFSAKYLARDGVLMAYAGPEHLPAVISALSRHLTYAWTVALVWRYGETFRIQKRIKTLWRPILVYCRGDYDAPDGIVDTRFMAGSDKEYHEWQQSVDEAQYYISRLTRPGDLVCDPFVGTGTTAVAAKALGRRFLGCDIDRGCVVIGQQRVREA